VVEGRRMNDGAEGKGGERTMSCDNHLLGHSPANGHALLLEKKNRSTLAKIYSEYVFECNMYNKNERWEYNQSRTVPLRFTICE
jgi:hypothetical protein